MPESESYRKALGVRSGMKSGISQLINVIHLKMKIVTISIQYSTPTLTP